MAYTAYRTWTTGEIVTAALMNEQVKDNGLLTAPAIMTGQGDLIYGSAANTPSRLAKDANSTRSLTNTGTNNNPAWAQVALATGVSGTLPVGNGGTGITSLGSNVATFLGTPSSANLRSALTDETGTGAAVFATSPTFVTPALGTPASGVLTNATGLPISGLANGTDGELITWNASGVAAAVAVGSDGQVLTSGGAGVAPTFEAASAGGKVLQVVSTQKGSGSGTSSTSWAAISGFSVTITPSATSSKIFVIATDNSLYRGNNSNYYVTLYRAGTNLGHSTGGYLYGYGTTSGAWMSISVLDSPNTTSATTYQIYARVATTGSIDFANGNAYANITAMEIGA